MTTEQQVIELIPEYVLGLLNDDDTALVEAYLESSDRIREELTSYNQTLDALALNTPLVELPPTLKSKMFAELDQREQLFDDPIMQNGRRGVALSSTNRSVQALEPHTIKLKSRRSWFNPWLMPAFLTASIVVNVVLVTQLLNQPEPEVAEVVVVVTPTPMEATEPAEVVVVPTPTATEPVIAAPAEIETVLNSISLVNSSNTEHGIIILSDDGVHGTLVVNGLPALEEGQQYQIWLSDGENVHTGGLFMVTPNGFASVSVNAPLPLHSYSEFGILLETPEEPEADDLILQSPQL